MSRIALTSTLTASPRRGRATLAALVVAVAILALAPPAQAGWWVQGIPGASCSPTNEIEGSSWEYDGRRLRNTATGPYEVFLASCPITLLQAGWDPVEYRVQFSGAGSNSFYCRAYRSDGTYVRTDWNDSSTWISGTLDYPLASNSGWIEMTLECLVHAGASLERIEIVWWKP